MHGTCGVKAALMLALAVASSCAEARVRALLVGVSEYPTLDQTLQLHGPQNDVASFRQFLIEQRRVDPHDIEMLADRVRGAQLPTRSAIVAGLSHLAAISEPGDQVVLMFAGHGSQQPARAGDVAKPDGLDKTFLPRDVGRWDGELATVHNAIIDDEFGSAIGRIRDRGAFVWAVFDACHSASMTRGMPQPGERDREVKPEVLGIDAATMLAAQQRASGRGERTRGGPARSAYSLGHGTDSAKGGFVAFYATQSDETEPEWPMPRYATDGVSHGLFSYTLQQVLASHPAATYRQVIEQVLQGYQGQALNGPTPSYEGTVLDSPVLGAGDAGVRQWRVDSDSGTLRMRAGLLNDVTPDSVLALVPDATSKDSEVIGYVKVTKAQTSVSEVVPVAYGGKSPPTLPASRKSWYARPVDLKIDLSLRVSGPVKNAICEAPSLQLLGAIAEIRKNPALAPRARWVEPTAAADIRLCQVRGQLAFLDGSGTVDNSRGARFRRVRLPEGEKSAQGPSPAAILIGEALQRIGRVANLARVAVAGSSATELDIKITHVLKSGTAEPVTPISRTVIHDGDEIHVQIQSTSAQDIDLTALYVSADYSITAMYPREGETSRIPSHGHISFDMKMGADTIGSERLLLIAVPAQTNSPRADFTDLAQEGLMARRGKTEGVQTPLAQLLDEAAFGTGASAATRGGHPGDARFASYAWTVVQ